MRDRDKDKISDYDLSSSTILTTRFGYESTRLIHLAQKNLYVIIGLIAALVVLSILNILGALDYFSTSSEEVDKIVDIVLLVVLIVVLAPLVLLLLRSKNVLDRWTDMFERNTIMTSMNLTMIYRTKEEVLRALSLSIREISKPLQEYIESRKTDLTEFFDISITTQNTKNLAFDIVVDSDRVLNDNSNSSDGLKSVLKEYGTIIVKMVDSCIDRRVVESFADSLKNYNVFMKHPVGVGLVIGDSITDDAREYANQISNHRRRQVTHLILIAKPSSSSVSSLPQQQDSII